MSPGPGRLDSVTRRRLFLSPLLLLVALLTGLGLNTSSASASAGPETRVRAINHVPAISVGNIDSETPGRVGYLRPETGQVMSGSCVATNTASGPADDLTRVGRWMSPDEHAAMVRTGEVQVGAGGTTYVANPADVNAFTPNRFPSNYVEFDVPTSSLRPAGQPGYAQIPTAENTMWGKLAPQRGWALPESPVSACNIVHVATKLSC